MENSNQKRIVTIVLFSVLLFAGVALVRYLFDMFGAEQYKWSDVIMSWAVIMYIAMAFGRVYGVSYEKYLYKVGLPILFVVNLVCGFVEHGFSWWALLLAVLTTLVSVVIVFVLSVLLRKNRSQVA